MRCIMLGTGTAVIRYHRGSPSVLIETEDKTRILVDCGWSVPSALLKVGVQVHELDHICLTHRHGDHFPSLAAILMSVMVSVFHYPEQVHKGALWLHGYPGMTADYFKMVLPQLPTKRLPEQRCQLAFNQYKEDASPFKVEGLSITMLEVRHVDYLRCVAFRIEEEGKVIVVTGDMGWDERIIPFMKDADIAIMDCGVNKHRGEQANHLTASQCGKLAALAGIQHVVLTHLDDSFSKDELHDGVREHYAGGLTIPNDLTILSL